MRRGFCGGLAIGLALGAVLMGAIASRASVETSSVLSTMRSATKTPLQETPRLNLSRLRLPFIANQGQVDPHVSFYAHTFGAAVFVTEDGKIVYGWSRDMSREKPRQGTDEAFRLKPVASSGVDLWAGEGIERKAVFVRESFLGARSHRPRGEDPSPTEVNYFRGKDPSTWQREVPTYQTVDLQEIYEGIGLKLRVRGDTVEKIFSVKPGADPRTIRVKVEGVRRLTISEEGALGVETDLGMVWLTKPVAYQEIDGQRAEVPAEYRLEAGDAGGDQSVPGAMNLQTEDESFGCVYAFHVGAYDTTKELIIDPLVASTILGGSGQDSGVAVAVGPSGQIYVMGETDGPYGPSYVNFPVTPGSYDQSFNGSIDCFVSKLSPDLSTLEASTLLGGNGADSCRGLAIDPQGNVYVTGPTSSSDFPTTPNAYLKTYERNDGFIAKLNPSLSQLLASTYIRVTNAYWSYEGFARLAIDKQGNVYAVGHIDNAGTLPPGGYKTTAKSIDLFIVKMSSDLSSLLASTFLGGDKVREYSENSGIAIDASGNVFVAGTTDWVSASDDSGNTIYANDFPVTPNAYMNIYGTDTTGCKPSFVAKLSSDLSTLLAATYLGGPGTSECGSTISRGYTFIQGIAVDPSGHVYVTGFTDTKGFPTTEGAFQRRFLDEDYVYGVTQGFISQFDNSLSSLLASTFIGGDWTGGIYGNDWPAAIVLDEEGHVYITGNTTAINFPVTPNAYATQRTGWQDGFVSKLDGNLSRLIYSTYLGGGDAEYSADTLLGIAVNSTGEMIVTGYTFFHYLPFYPLTPDAYDTTPNGEWYTRDVVVSILKEPKELTVQLLGEVNVSPGAETTFALKYQNSKEETAENVVLVFVVPQSYRYLRSSNGGIYNDTLDSQQVFWRLGNLEPEQGGEVSVTVQVPWGFPNTEVPVSAYIAASNAPIPNVDLYYYLNLEIPNIVTRNELTSPEVDALLSSNAQMRSLLEHVQNKGYMFFSEALETFYDNGMHLLTLFLLGPDVSSFAMLIDDGARTFIVEHEGYLRKVYDQSGGYQYDLETGSFSSWGNWAVPGSLTEALCQFNCTSQKVPDWVLKHTVEIYRDLKKIQSCAICAKTSDKYACAKCANVFLQMYKKIPGVSETIDTVKCLEECLTNPDKYVCTEDKRECTQNIFGWLGGFYTIATYKCNTTTGTLSPVPQYTNCAYGDDCIDGHCPPKACNNKYQCAKKKQNVRAAHDPNAKSLDVAGNVLPGQRLTYTIEYENVGTGTAYEVFILDKLDENLDASTLQIENGGTYTASGRLLSWEIGTLPPCTASEPDVCKGSVTFHINVKKGLPSGTEITNFAEVHFPSANEVTPTNAVVSVVNSLAADPKTVETLSQAPVSIVLSGRDSGNQPLSFQISRAPMYGELSGTPPKVTYTSMSGFSGQDDFEYTVSNGKVVSEPARVVIQVSPNPADTTPPEVVSTNPRNNASNVPVLTTPLFTNPPVYPPSISVVFSEPIDGNTVTSKTFFVEGLQGTVSYDEASRTGIFFPSVPLEPSTTYVVRVTTGVRDKVGNAMAFEYTWRFSTASEQNIEVYLPDNRDDLPFGTQQVKTISQDQVINVSNTGSAGLSISKVTLSGADKDQFTITTDQCSGNVLEQNESCILKVAFKPTTMGRKRAVLSIESNDPDMGVSSVILSGVGI